ncbi:MAG: arylsulfatase [Chloroflexi bacterium]|nr:arylsulfatase [Chloroflexota bacterium]
MAEQVKPSERPNVVLIMVDQWRGDCLSVAGHPVVHTPYLDQLALRGARFTCAYSATPTCIPARAALFTGLTQRSHGRVGYQDGVPWDYVTTLAGEFTRQGYQTQAVGKMHVYPERSQMGFQNVILHDGFLHFARRQSRNYDWVDDYNPWLREQLGRQADYFDHGVNCNSYVARPWDKDEYLHPTTWVVSQSIDFLRRRDPRKPFFLFMSFHRPHPPYDPPAWAFEMYADTPMPSVPVGDWVDILSPWAEPRRPDCFVDAIEPRLLQRARAGYYGHMTHIDHQLNRFLEVLDEYGLGENTFILFTSDHGEMMGDHHLFRKAYPYEGSAHIPMILAAPKGSHLIPRGEYRHVVELRDVMPTLLDCCGLEIPSEVEGQSFLPIAQGKEVPWRPYLHGEHTVFGQSLHYVTDGHQKYVWFSGNGHEQLFDLDHDPTECHDLAQDPSWQARLAEWRQILIRELDGREEGFTDGQRLIPGRPVHPCLSFLRHRSE